MQPAARHSRRRLGALERRTIPRRRAMMAVMKDEPVPFVVGRIAKADRRMVVLEKAIASPIPGPWDLRAVFGL
jgi:hypothetical protein